MTTQPRENKMGIMPVGRLLFTMSLPIMISMFIQALYNVVDSMFVAQISENALTAVTLSYPFQHLMIAVSTGTGVGINALLSRNLGEKKFAAANKVAVNGVFISVLSAIAFMILGLSLARFFFSAQTDIPEIIEYGTTYLSICSGLCIGVFVEVAFNRLLQSTGRTIFTMIVQGTGAIINIIMDPVLIFGYGPFPEMGVAGAALATVLGQIIGACLAVLFNMRFNTDVKLKFKGFRPDPSVLKGIYAVGVPSILLSSIGSVMTFGMNKILIAFSSTASAAFGIYFKMWSFVLMPILGLNNGSVPIIAYNFGARNRARIVRTIQLALLASITICLLGLLLFQLLPGQILRLFNASEDMLVIGIPALRTASFSLLFAGFCVIVLSALQALGKGVRSMILSFVRQLVVLLPAAYLLSLTGNLNLVWLAFPIAELVCAILSAIFLRNTYRKIIKPLESPVAQP